MSLSLFIERRVLCTRKTRGQTKTLFVSRSTQSGTFFHSSFFTRRILKREFGRTISADDLSALRRTAKVVSRRR